ncbi:DNA/RNA non-specific endonuclease [Actimicrobium antarcticum]|uniref:Endonuclease n=1 Tax=Actimicrobium antarcticum TaxID=1051899 RepID=A0ABP7SSN6_9BURK
MLISLKKTVATAILLMAAATSSAATSADFSKCRQLFAGGALPVLKNASMAPRALCYDNFAVLHSGRSRTPIYVAERLNKDNLDNKITRGTRFFADARLPSGERAELADYKQSGFDRGHMAPAGDMATDAAMAQSFSLANMVPQATINNRKPWAAIEKATRNYVLRASGDVYVITGPVFDIRPATIGANRVWVPQSLFKLVYDPATRRAWVHWLDNTDDARVGKPISYEELVRRTGIDFMPGIRG